jgi:hypothetical protein
MYRHGEAARILGTWRSAWATLQRPSGLRTAGLRSGIVATRLAFTIDKIGVFRLHVPRELLERPVAARAHPRRRPLLELRGDTLLGGELAAGQLFLSLELFGATLLNSELAFVVFSLPFDFGLAADFVLMAVRAEDWVLLVSVGVCFLLCLTE